MKLVRLSAITAAAVALLGVLSSASVSADTVILNTESSTAPSGFTHGLWREFSGHGELNKSYFTGWSRADGNHRSFFSFDLSTLTGNVTSAQLELRGYYESPDLTEQLGLFEVTTPVTTLVANVTSDSATIASVFNDLGSGVSYGTFDVSKYWYAATLTFDLNEQAMAAINAAKGSFFSIGAAVLSLSESHDVGVNYEGLFGSSGNTAAKLILTTTAVPLPASLYAGAALLGVLCFLHFMRRRPAAA